MSINAGGDVAAVASHGSAITPQAVTVNWQRKSLTVLCLMIAFSAAIPQSQLFNLYGDWRKETKMILITCCLVSRFGSRFWMIDREVSKRFHKEEKKHQLLDLANTMERMFFKTAAANIKPLYSAYHAPSIGA